MRQGQYFPGLDLVRIFAAMLVLIYHYGFQGWVGAGPVPDGARGAEVFPVLSQFARHAWVGVDIFFVLSGLVIAQSARGRTAGSFARSRFLRLVPTAWICATLTLLIVQNPYPPLPPLNLYVSTLLFDPAGPWIDGAFWTLGIEVNFYILAAALLAIGRYRMLFPILAIVGVVSSSLCFMAYLRIGGVDGWLDARWIQLSLLHHGHYFALGVLLWRIYDRRDASVMDAVLATAFLAGAFGEVRWLVRTESIVPFAIFSFGLAGIIASVFGNELFSLSQRSINTLRILGLATYPLYLLHSQIGRKIIREGARAGIDQVACLVIATLVCIGLALGVVYLERFIKSHAFRLSQPNAPPA